MFRAVPRDNPAPITCRAHRRSKNGGFISLDGCLNDGLNTLRRLVYFRRMELHTEDDGLVSRCLDDEELERNPELGLDVLEYYLHKSINSENLRKPLWAKLAHELAMGWLDARQPLKFSKAGRLLAKAAGTDLGEDFVDENERSTIRYWAGKQGRRTKLRKAGIMALMRRHYLDKPWKEITARVCPCGENHNDPRVMKYCTLSLQSERRMLKRMLAELKITLPKPPMVFIWADYVPSTPLVRGWGE